MTQDLPEEVVPLFQEHEALVIENQKKMEYLAEKYQGQMNPADVIRQRLEMFIDFVLPKEDRSDSEALKKRLTFEIMWQTMGIKLTLDTALSQAEGVIAEMQRRQVLARLTHGIPGVPPVDGNSGGLIVPGK